jgi:FHA domain
MLLASAGLAVLGVSIFVGLFLSRSKSDRHSLDHRRNRPLAPLMVPAREPLAPLRRTPLTTPAAPHSSGGPMAAPTPVAVRPEAAARPLEPLIASDHAVVEGGTVRFSRVAEGTLQLLPGRLEIIEGDDRGHDVRFVRSRPGVPEITFGRNEGSPHRHVQLLSRTVSREHARMRFEGDRWSIVNLSRTNPVILNGEELPEAESSRVLNDGDRIEMGEIVFRFHSR